MPLPEVFIASVYVHHHYPLLAPDDHFRRVLDLKLIGVSPPPPWTQSDFPVENPTGIHYSDILFVN